MLDLESQKARFPYEDKQNECEYYESEGDE